MPFLDLLLKAFANALINAAGNKAAELASEMVCKAAGGCPEKTREIGDEAIKKSLLEQRDRGE